MIDDMDDDSPGSELDDDLHDDTLPEALGEAIRYIDTLKN